jgi:membrane-associated phospholipid phosphatase
MRPTNTIKPLNDRIKGMGANAMSRSHPRPYPYTIRWLVLLFGVVGPSGLFTCLAEEVLKQRALCFDQPILWFLHRHASPLYDGIMLFFTKAGSSLVLIPFSSFVFLALLWRKMTIQTAFWAISVGGAYLLNVVAKMSFTRPRPGLWISISPESTFSFPSAHAMYSMAVVSALVLLTLRTHWTRHVTAFGAAFVLLVGLSRIYLGVHYPSDIIAGWAAALGWVIGLSLLFNTKMR